jgi:hypothetical protein
MLAATLDPDGRRVVLDEHAWTHIKRKHPSLAGSQREIMAAVREPERRMIGRVEGEVWFFTQTAEPLRWLQVVVHYEGDDGWIVTAFRRASLPKR